VNLYVILGAIVIMGAALFGAERAGESRGHALQAVTDQVQFDHVNAQLTAQKAQANALIQAAADQALAKQRADADLLRHQEHSYENDLAATDLVRRSAAAERLRVTVNVPDSGSRPGSGDSVRGEDATAGATRTETVELPAQVGQDLRDLVFDADQLADAYRKCYRAEYPDWNPSLTSANPAPTPELEGATP
jgi:hypothetical protein